MKNQDYPQLTLMVAQEISGIVSLVCEYESSYNIYMRISAKEQKEIIKKIHQETGNILEQKLESTIDECNKHLKWLNKSYDNIKHLFPLTSQSYHDLGEEIIPNIDQFIYRFTKLLDTMGKRLFSAILLKLAEEPKNLSFIDMLNRLEQLTIIPSKDMWLDLRNLRNLASHEYDDVQNADILNKLFNSVNIIKDIYQQAISYINQK